MLQFLFQKNLYNPIDRILNYYTLYPISNLCLTGILLFYDKGFSFMSLLDIRYRQIFSGGFRTKMKIWSDENEK